MTVTPFTTSAGETTTATVIAFPTRHHNRVHECRRCGRLTIRALVCDRCRPQPRHRRAVRRLRLRGRR